MPLKWPAAAVTVACALLERYLLMQAQVAADVASQASYVALVELAARGCR